MSDLSGDNGELRLLLLGNIGCGKTSSADTILDQQAPISLTTSRSLQQRQGFSEGRRVTVVEAPRWYWNGGQMDEDIRKETEKAMKLLAPGPHAILLLIPVFQFTEMETQVPGELEKLFGDEVLNHTLVLLTCGDYLIGKSAEDYLKKESPGLTKVIERCDGRYHVFNNRQRQNRMQVQQLLDKVDEIVQKTGIHDKKTTEEREIERRIAERKRELMESYRAKREMQRPSINSMFNTDTETLNTDRTVMDSGRTQPVTTFEERVDVKQVTKGLHSTPATDQQLSSTPSFKLNEDGAILSQISEPKSAPKSTITRAFHHRINNSEERSTVVSPPSSAHSPVFSSSSIVSPPSSTKSPVFSSSPIVSPPSSTKSPVFSSPIVSPPSSAHSPVFSSSSIVSPPSSAHSLVFSSSPVVSPPSSSHSPVFSSSPGVSPPSSTHSPVFSSSPGLSPPSSAHSPVFSSSPGLSPPSSAHSPVFSSSPSSTFASASAFYYPSASACTPSSDLRLVLVGRSGAGKSFVGNSILGCEAFRSDIVTLDCVKKKTEVCGRKVAVVDTPDWFNSEKTLEEVRAQISSCVALSSPGPHAFLICIPVDQPAKTEIQALRSLETVFGTDAVQKHTIALFTFAERLKKSGKAGDKSVEEYIAKERPDLLKVVEVCRDRFYIMDSVKGKSNVSDLLETVDQTVKEAGGQWYSSPAFQEAENKVRQKQMEIAMQQRGLQEERRTQVDIRRDKRKLSSDKQFTYMQPLVEEEVNEDVIEKTRAEAEMSVSTMENESLPTISLSDMSPSLLQSLREKMEMLPDLLANGSTWVYKGAESVRNSQMWEKVGSNAQTIQKMVADSPVWAQVGARTEHISKAVGDRMPQVVKDGSAWVGSGAKAAAASPVWGQVGSGAKYGAQLVASSSKNLAQSPVWGQMGSGAKNQVKMVAESPVWGKMGEGAKAGAKRVAESPLWEKIGDTAKQVPKVVIGAAVLGLVLGVLLGGVIGGAIGAAAGSAAAEVGRRKIGSKSTLQNTEVKNVEGTVRNSVDSLVKTGEKVWKVE